MTVSLHGPLAPLRRWGTVALLLVSATVIAFLLRPLIHGLLLRLSDEGVRITYFRDTDLKSAVCTRYATDLAADYGTSRPAMGVPADGWSARWEADLRVPATNTYEFVAKSDDGLRLWIDDKLLLDNWRRQDFGRSLCKAEVLLHKGRHRLRMEHFKYDGEAAVQVRWIDGPIRSLRNVTTPYLRKPKGRPGTPHEQSHIHRGHELQRQRA